MPTSPHWAVRIRRRFPLKQIVPPGRCGHRPLRKSGGILQIPPLRSLFNSERGTMNHNDAFSRCHPLVNFLYFALVLLGAMVLRHPVCQVLSLIGAIACFCCLGGEKPGGFRLWYALALVVLTAAVNPAFSHEGRTILRYLPSGNPLTLESVLYGLGAGLTLCTALIWFSDYTRVMTSDKFVYLFGRIVPALSLVLSMTLRFVPRFSAQARRVSRAQAAVGNDMHAGSPVHRVRCALMVFSILVTWSLERTRSTRRTPCAPGATAFPEGARFQSSRLRKRDRLLLSPSWVCWAELLSPGYGTRRAFVAVLSERQGRRLRALERSLLISAS